MPEQSGKHIIRSLQKRWIAYSILYVFLCTLGIALLITVSLHIIAGSALWWCIPVFLLLFIIVMTAGQYWKTREKDITRFLNQTYPELEESSGLVLQPYASLNLLEQLQFSRTEQALASIPKPEAFNKKIRLGIGIFFAAILLCVMLLKISSGFPKYSSATDSALPAASKTGRPEKILPQISTVRLTIKPPAYTARGIREQDKFSLEAEEGAAIAWQLQTTAPVTSLQFIFNDTLSYALHASGDAHTSWNLEKKITSQGFYQVKIDGILSELYKIEMIKDQPPLIHIQSPKQYTTIDYGEPQKVPARIDLSDDYGISEAYISATVANGSGESVKFKEQKLPIPGFNAGYRKYQLQKLLQLADLGMHPGDELYFYVNATDNHNQQSRSDVFIVTIQDTAQLMSLEGLANGINIKPEYFRSERQIIIETEQLIKDKPTLTDEAFKNKSNDLGIDQKLLRLRYGKFLGEESESNIPGGSEDDGKELSDPSNFGNAAVVMDKFTDKHDNAEDANFFEPELKKQLKATLTEMWNAELQLRTMKPQDALQYEYKALRLLKDLQQKSRAYVAKTSFKPAALKPEKRMTGELDKIGEPVTQQNISRQEDSSASLRAALGILEQLKITGVYIDIPLQSIMNAAQQLNKKAAAEPSVYLPAAQSMRKIIASLQDKKTILTTDLLIAENGLHRILSIPVKVPSATKNSAGLSLSQQYFINLNRAEQKP